MCLAVWAWLYKSCARVSAVFAAMPPECSALTLWDTGTVQTMFPLEKSCALVLELRGSAARIPLERSCLLYSDTSGFHRMAGGTLEINIDVIDL